MNQTSQLKTFLARTIAVLVLATFVSITARADASGTCGKTASDQVNWSYVESTKTLTIAGTGAMADYDLSSTPWYSNYRKDIKTIVIESGVTSIGKYAFASCKNLSSVTIPTSVTSIGIGSFQNCESLSSITIPSSVTSIGDLAFSYCMSLLSITIPSSVTSIGNMVFYICSSLSSIIVDNDNPNYKSEDGVMFSKDGTTLICYPAGKDDSSYTIPSSVTSISYCAFKSCTSLSSITMSEGVTNIDESAFASCKNISSFTIPSSVTSIGKGAFDYCNNLQNLYVLRDNSTSITTLGGSTFYSAPTDFKIWVPSGALSDYKQATNWSNYKNNIYGFGYCGVAGHESDVICALSGTSLNIMKVGTTGAMADYDDISYRPWANSSADITSIDIGSGVTHIGKLAFSGCTGLSSVTLPTSVTGIDYRAFYNCTNLATVTLNSNPFIGNEAFYGIAPDATVTMNLTANSADDAYWMTFYNGYSGFTPDANTTVYKGKVSSDKSNVQLTAVADIPKAHAVVLKSSAATITLTLDGSANADLSDNEFLGSDVDLATPANAYCLSNETSGSARGVGFYTFTGATIPAHKAYLVVDGGPSTSRGFLGFGDDDNTTGIALPEAGVIEGDGPIYDLSGRRVTGQPQKGIYVKNGKKIIIK